MSASYICHRVNLDGSLSMRDNCDDFNAMEIWVGEALGVHATIQVQNEQSGEIRRFTDAGETWQRLAA